MDSGLLTLSSVENLEHQLAYHHQEQLLKLQRDILEAVAISHSHEAHLINLCRASEAMLPNAVASVMLFDENRERLTVRSAPSIPKAAIEQLNGLVPGPHSGSCGTAVYNGEAVYVENTITDDRWKNVRQFAIDFNINACWSNPIHSGDGRIIGSFALTSFTHRKPETFHKTLLSVCANLVGLIIQREGMEKSLQQLTYYDKLTALPNRELLNQRVEHAIEQAQRRHNNLALLCVDIDNFKLINDSYGHDIGDEVLIRIASVLQQCIQENDTLARTGGDEFVIMLENLNDPFKASLLAEKIQHEINTVNPIHDANITLSIGISIFPDDADNHRELRRNADTAMYAAKSSGKNNILFYKPELTQSIQQRLRMIKELRQAIQNGEFVLHFQPIYEGHTLAIKSAETLIRWQHPEKGLLMPVSFIQLAEQNGLINQITDWVIQHACQQAKNWLEMGVDFNKISVNLTADDITAGFHQRVQEIMDNVKLPPQHLEFEITESILMEQGETAIKELEKVRELGISIALDDFGTGYSSLNQLRRLPLDKLKIDRAFIKDTPEQEDDVVLTKTIISMGKNLSLKVVAEGVETEQQLDFLKQEGCDFLQGFLLSRPIPEAEFLTLLSNQTNAS